MLNFPTDNETTIANFVIKHNKARRFDCLKWILDYNYVGTDSKPETSRL